MLTGTGSAIVNGGNITERLLTSSTCGVNILAACRGVAIGVMLLVARKSIPSEGVLEGGITAWLGASAAGWSFGGRPEGRLSMRNYNWNDWMDCSRGGIEDLGWWDFLGRSSGVVVATIYNLFLLVSEMAIFSEWTRRQFGAHFRFIRAWTGGGICIFNLFIDRMGEVAKRAVVAFLLAK